MPNIIGLGIDLTEIPRIVSTIDRYGTRFLQRIFTEGEIAYCMRRKEAAIHFAGRFASKEAAMKASGPATRRVSSGVTSKWSVGVDRRNSGCMAEPPGDSRRWAGDPLC